VGSASDKDWKNWIVASAVWLLDGYVMLGQPNATPRIADALSGLPRASKEILFSIVTGLFTRQTRALEATESYCYENFSRYKWRTYAGHAPHMHSGIPGVELLGTNHIQRMWAFYNEIEDRRQTDETMWEGFKLSVSPHSPKGVKKIDAKDQETRDKETARQQEAQDRFYLTRIGVLKPLAPKSKVTGPVPPSAGPKTVEALEDEMLRWVSGEADWHDQIVTDYKRRISESYERGKQEREARRQALRAQQSLMEAETGPSRMVAYTADQLADILKTRQPGPAGVRTVQSTPAPREHLYSKYLQREPDAGLLKVEGQHLVSGGEPIGPRSMSLSEQVADRQVEYRVAEDED
jgi:hypothetical protein